MNVNNDSGAQALVSPAITGVVDGAGKSLLNPDTTNETALTLSGTGDANVVVIIYDNGVPLGTASVTTNGTWEKSETGLVLGRHVFTVQVSGGPQSAAWVITVEEEAGIGTPPAPTVQNAVGGTLNPIAAKDLLIVDVPQYPGMAGTDKISVTWTGPAGSPAGASHTTALVDVGTVGVKQIEVPPSVLAFSLGKTVTVKYTVVHGGINTDSLLATVAILPLPVSELSPPRILQAANNGEGAELDVTALTADATIRVDSWPLIAVEQYVWLTLTGTKADGSGYSKQVWTPPGSRTNTSWISNGYYDATVPQAELKALKDGSQLTATFKAALDGTQVEGNALTFPLRTYNVKALEVRVPVITSVKDAQDVDIPEGGTTYGTTVKLQGTATPGQEVDILDGAASLGRRPVDPTTGIWTLTISGLVVKAYSIKAKGLYGSPNPESAVRNFTVAAVVTPEITRVSGSHGNVQNGGTTQDTSLTVTGTGAPNTTLDILDGSSVLGPVTVTANGSWSYPMNNLAFRQYSITARARAGSNPVSNAWRFTVERATVPIVIDTSPVTLNGKLYTPGHTNPINWPANTRVTRVPTSGTPPYTYSSSYTGAAIVTEAGLVSAQHNGSTVITVRDNAGQSASYSVTVTGVIECTGLGNLQYPAAVNAAQGRGKRIPSMAELREIYGQYGTNWPLGNGGYFSSTSAGGIPASVYIKNLYTGAEGTAYSGPFGGFANAICI